MNNNRMDMVNKKRAILKEVERGMKLEEKQIVAVKNGDEKQIAKIYREMNVA